MANRSIKSSHSWLTYAKFAFLGFSLVTAIFFILIYSGFFGPVPPKSELSEIRNYEASQIISSDGNLLGTYFLKNRIEVELNEVNPVFIDALLAVEDIRFHEHNGVDFRAMARVLIKSILLGRDAGGGSTITQQLAKNLYPRSRSGLIYIVADKFREMIIARRLEAVYTKEDILELYLNNVSFGEEIFGVELASRRYFNKSSANLELDEAATIAGMLKATTRYNPRKYPERSKKRRDLVINQMQKYGKITQEIAQEAQELSLAIDYNRISVSEGPAPYFREHLRQEMKRILEEIPALDSAKYNLYTDGLTIKTTLDSRVQAAAEHALEKQMKHLQAAFNVQLQDSSIFDETEDSAILWAWKNTDHYQRLHDTGASEEEINKILHTPVQTEVFTWAGEEQRLISPYDSLRHYLSFLNAGFIAMQPNSGNVRAWVGGINHHHFKYDHVKARRQAGSAFKPILYATAIENGREPCDYERNLLTTYADYEQWTPKNTGDEYGGRYSLQAALAKSVNTVAVNLIMKTGISNVQNTAKEMGIRSYIPSEPSIALGTAGVSLMELTTAYSTFLNDGNPAEPKIIEAIYNAQGELIYDFAPQEDPEEKLTLEYARDASGAVIGDVREEHSALSDETAAAMVNMLEKSVNEGSGRSLRTRFGITHALAGKTGTTQNYTDGWFVGMTPDLVFGSWVGGWNPRVHFSGSLGYGSQSALPIVGHFLNNLQTYKDLEPQALSFYPDQIDSPYNLACSDFVKDKITDRVKDFFSGRDDDEPRVVKKEKKSRSIFGKIKSLFTKD